jgi:hypothetical protein
MDPVQFFVVDYDDDDSVVLDIVNWPGTLDLEFSLDNSSWTDADLDNDGDEEFNSGFDGEGKLLTYWRIGSPLDTGADVEFQAEISHGSNLFSSVWSSWDRPPSNHTFCVVGGNDAVTPYDECANQPPTADAGPDELFPCIQYDIVIEGTASDPDGDSLTYRWLEGETVLLGWTSVNENGECPLDLSAILIGTGTYILTLEVSDGQATSTDDMILTICGPVPTVEILIENVKIDMKDGKFGIKGHFSDVTDPDFADLLVDPQFRIRLELQTGGTSTDPEFGIVGIDQMPLTSDDTKMNFPAP